MSIPGDTSSRRPVALWSERRQLKPGDIVTFRIPYDDPILANWLSDQPNRSEAIVAALRGDGGMGAPVEEENEDLSDFFESMGLGPDGQALLDP